MNEMNGKIIGRKPLYIAFAQRKEERRTHLQVSYPSVSLNCITCVLKLVLSHLIYVLFRLCFL